MKRIFSLSLLLLIISFSSFGQGIKTPQDIKSPNAAGLGKYGDTPVDYYNGAANINVPLYAINQEQLPLNIGLSYDMSGIKINSLAGWVGQNWSLNTGGIIVRTQRGSFIDEHYKELPVYGGSYTWKEKGYYYARNRLNVTNWTSTTFLGDLVHEAVKPADQEQANNAYYKMDLEPDIFSFNFMGHVGKFFLGNDGVWKVQSNSNLKITNTVFENNPNFINPISNIQGVNYFQSIKEISIVDDYGNTFIFGRDSDAVEYSVSDFYYQAAKNGRSTPIYSNAWHLVEVKSRDNEIIYSFTYERGKPIANLSRAYSIQVGTCLSSDFQTNANAGVELLNYYKEGYDGNLVFPSYLKNIATRTGEKIDFYSSDSGKSIQDDPDFTTPAQNGFYESPYPSSGWWYRYLYLYDVPVNDAYSQPDNFNPYDKLEWRKLDSIRVTKENDELIIGYNLNYNTSSSNVRLNLESIDKIGKNNTIISNYYRFEYDDFDSVPGFSSMKYDHWGYYNGQDFALDTNGITFVFNTGVDPLAPSYYENHFDSRESDILFSLKGLLKKIYYPTKGYTNFIYEPNKANYLVNENKVVENYPSPKYVGGARIKEIANFDENNIATIRQFSYDKGYLFYIPAYEHPSWQVGGIYDTYYYFNLNNVIPLSNMNGSHIGYSEVTETYQDNSKNVYKYTDYNLFPDIAYESTLAISHSVFDKSTDRSFLRGKLKSKESYNSNNILAEKSIFNYRNTQGLENTSYVRAFEYSYSKLCSFGANYGNAYKLFYFDYDVVQEQKTNYLENGSITTTTNYEKSDYSISSNESIFNGSRSIESISQTDSNGDIIMTEYKYPKDFISSENVYKKMVDNNMNNYPIEVINKRNGQVISAQINEFIDDNDRYLIKRSYLLEDNNAVPNYSLAQPNQSSSILIKDDKMAEKFTVDLYDDRGNILQLTQKDDTPISYIWDYNKTLLIAKVKNVTYNQLSPHIANIQSRSNSDDDNCTININYCHEQTLRNSLNDLRDFFPNALITSYTYDPLVGVTSITDPTRDIIYYEYDELSRLKRTKDKNEKILNEYEYNYKN